MFSIAIPVYTPYKVFLTDAIDSILRQSCTDFELLLICGDHSCDVLFPDDKRIKPIYLDKDDVSSKRNAALNYFSGDYLLFLDTDDRLHPDILECIDKIVCREKVDVVCFGFTRDPLDFESPLDAEDESYFFGHEAVIDVCFKNMLSPSGADPTIFDSACGKAWSRRLIQRTNTAFVVPPCRAEDAIFARTLYLEAESIVILLRTVGYYWRINEISVMQTATPAWLDMNGYLSRIKPIVEKTPFFSEQAFYDYGAGLFYQEIRSWLERRKKKKMSAAKLKDNIRSIYTKKGTVFWDCIQRTNLSPLTLRLAKKLRLFVFLSPVLHHFLTNSKDYASKQD